MDKYKAEQECKELLEQFNTNKISIEEFKNALVLIFDELYFVGTFNTWFPITKQLYIEYIKG